MTRPKLFASIAVVRSPARWQRSQTSRQMMEAATGKNETPGEVLASQNRHENHGVATKAEKRQRASVATIIIPVRFHGGWSCVFLSDAE
ncbi:hypothetical protein MTO96_004811 [Rhipicephalus appendiculatus]